MEARRAMPRPRARLAISQYRVSLRSVAKNVVQTLQFSSQLTGCDVEHQILR